MCLVRSLVLYELCVCELWHARKCRRSPIHIFNENRRVVAHHKKLHNSLRMSAIYNHRHAAALFVYKRRQHNINKILSYLYQAYIIYTYNANI